MFSVAAVMDAVVPAIPLHALINMYNSSIQDLSVTAGRKVPEYTTYWQGQRLAKTSNVLKKEAKDLGVDDIPEDAMKRLMDMFEEIEASGEKLAFQEIGEEITKADGRKEYVPIGWTVNGRPVEKAVHPYFRRHYKNMIRRKGEFVLTTDPCASLFRDCDCMLMANSPVQQRGGFAQSKRRCRY